MDELTGQEIEQLMQQYAGQGASQSSQGSELQTSIDAIFNDLKNAVEGTDAATAEKLASKPLIDLITNDIESTMLDKPLQALDKLEKLLQDPAQLQALKTDASLLPTLKELLSTLYTCKSVYGRLASNTQFKDFLDIVGSEDFKKLLGTTGITLNDINADISRISAATGQKLSVLDYLKAVNPDTGNTYLGDLVNARTATLPAAEQAQAQEQFKFVSKRIKTMYQPISKIAQGLLDTAPAPIPKTGKFEAVTVSPAGAKNPVNVLVKFEGKANYTDFDKDVQDAIASLYLAGNEYCTADTVFRAMSGKTNTEYCSPDMANKILDSIERQRHTVVTIDARQEYAAYKGKTKAARAFNDVDVMLRLQEASKEIEGGFKAAIYRIKELPIIYRHASTRGQIVATPAKLLAIKDNQDKTASVSATERSIVIRFYLQERIGIMKADEEKAIAKYRRSKSPSRKIEDFRKVSRDIVLQTIYDKLGEQDATRRVKLLIRKEIMNTLDFYKDESHIKGYAINKNGAAIHSITIIF